MDHTYGVKFELMRELQTDFETHFGRNAVSVVPRIHLICLLCGLKVVPPPTMLQSDVIPTLNLNAGHRMPTSNMRRCGFTNSEPSP